MVKTIIKETCIILLLCVAILLVLGIVFYEYIPISKVIPNKVTYTVPEEVKNELDSTPQSSETTTQTLTYEIDSGDLKKYEKSGVLDKGKSNPFSVYSSGNDNTLIDNTVGNGGNGKGNNNQNYFYNTVGK